MLTVMKSGELIETAIVGREGVVGGWVGIDGRNARYSRGKIMILDRKRLEARACECYEAIKHENLSLRIGIKL